MMPIEMQDTKCTNDTFHQQHEWGDLSNNSHMKNIAFYRRHFSITPTHTQFIRSDVKDNIVSPFSFLFLQLLLLNSKEFEKSGN